MRYVCEEVDGEVLEHIDTGEIDLDGDRIMVGNADGFGACDIEIDGTYLTWAQLDKLKEAIAEAERRWRK